MLVTSTPTTSNFQLQHLKALQAMAHSLSDTCTPLKQQYDACFNAWFEGYLEPAVAASKGTPEERAAYSQAKAAEYERNCGALWTQYRDCVQVGTVYQSFEILLTFHSQRAVKDKGLDGVLEEARKDNPLEGSPSPNNVSVAKSSEP